MRSRTIIAGGTYFTAGEPSTEKPDSWKGFGGRKMTVRFLDDGAVLRTDDLMQYQATTKPDTAEIFEGDECTHKLGWVKVGNPGDLYGFAFGRNGK